MDKVSSNSLAVWTSVSDEVQISEGMVVYFDGLRCRVDGPLAG